MNGLLPMLEQLLQQAYRKHLLDRHHFFDGKIELGIGQVHLSLDPETAVLFLCRLVALAPRSAAISGTPLPPDPAGTTGGDGRSPRGDDDRRIGKITDRRR